MNPAVATGLLCTALLTGCSGAITVDVALDTPACPSEPALVSRSLVLLAQSVPTSGWLPCIRSLPVGWTFTRLDAHDGGATFALNSDREGNEATTVVLGPACSVVGATEIPSEQPGTKRYERVDRVSNGYAGERSYTYDGGCITYRFNLSGRAKAEPIAAVTEALGFVSRDMVRQYVRDRFGGQLELDPS